MTYVVKTGYMSCSGVVLVHANRRFTCTSPDCHVPDFWRSVLDAHELFVPCGEELGSACPICSDPCPPNVEPSHSFTRLTDSAFEGWLGALGIPSQRPVAMSDSASTSDDENPVRIVGCPGCARVLPPTVTWSAETA
jgi:hypothetical protein